MIGEKAAAAAARLWTHYQEQSKIDELPADCRPASRADGYEVQARVVKLAAQPVVGWKIAATSAAGQKHINVDGPLVAALFANRVIENAAAPPDIPMHGNIMNVAEAEFAFRFGTDLPSRATPYTREEVVAAVSSLHPSIEVPDSRYSNFVKVGAAQLISDLACSYWFLLGPATRVDWRSRDLVGHKAAAVINGTVATSGSGANVLGDPLEALTWSANEISRFAGGIKAGQFVTTGACAPPPPVKIGDVFTAEFGDLGSATVRLAP